MLRVCTSYSEGQQRAALQSGEEEGRCPGGSEDLTVERDLNDTVGSRWPGPGVLSTVPVAQELFTSQASQPVWAAVLITTSS